MREKLNLATPTEVIQTYLERFAEFERRAAGREIPWLSELRREAFARFCERGFPTTHDEEWRFTNTSAISKTSFRLQNVRSRLTARQIEPWRVKDARYQLVFLDGCYAPELSILNKADGTVTVADLAKELSANSKVIEKYFGRHLDVSRDSFSALNTAFAESGAYVHVPRNSIVEEPIFLLFISSSDTSPIMSHPRNLIVVDDESQATIVEEYVSLGNGTFFCNSVTELLAGDNAVISHYRIEREQADTANVSTLSIYQGRSANVASHSVLRGGSLVRNNVHTVLSGEGGECLINGLFFGRGNQQIDNYMLVEHASPHCTSRQFYNGILDERAHGVFHGRIIVHKEAQKTDAKQTNRNLLLSDDAQIDTKPQLEIHADDVKCTHGATIGQIDDEALFYLRSRGIDETSARNALLLAFAGECLARMQQGPARKHVEALVNQYILQIANTPRGLNAQKNAERDFEVPA
jgi:Fe-S cluster assembly protein SufD